MLLSYSNHLFEENNPKRVKVKADITTEHSASSYGQPVVVLPDGGAIDLMSWIALDYRVERASKREKRALYHLGLI